jgi:hypothetical protein
MSVQCLVDPDEAVELLAGIGLVDPDVPLVPLVPVLPVPVVPVEAVLVLVPVLVLVVVAASATSAPPAIRPPVSPAMAITFLRRNFIITAPSVGVTHSLIRRSRNTLREGAVGPSLRTSRRDRNRPGRLIHGSTCR